MRNVNGMKLSGGRVLLAWFANNRGRTHDNVSLAVVADGEPRASHAAKQSGVLASCRTSGWMGDVNMSRAVRAKLGI